MSTCYTTKNSINDLSNRERKTLDYIVSFVEKNGVSPTQREISKGSGQPRGSVFRILDLLCAKGYLTIAKGIPRGIKLTSKPKMDSTKNLIHQIRNDKISLWNDLSKEILDKTPVLHSLAYVKLIDWAETLEGQSIVLTAPTPFIADQLKSKQGLLQQSIKEKLGTLVDVKIQIGQKTDCSECEIAKLATIEIDLTPFKTQKWKELFCQNKIKFIIESTEEELLKTCKNR
jgi:sugar-specific transcriptional regulator TrmB